jgi:hypothetical protein
MLLKGNPFLKQTLWPPSPVTSVEVDLIDMGQLRGRCDSIDCTCGMCMMNLIFKTVWEFTGRLRRQSPTRPPTESEPIQLAWAARLRLSSGLRPSPSVACASGARYARRQPCDALARARSDRFGSAPALSARVTALRLCSLALSRALSRSLALSRALSRSLALSRALSRSLALSRALSLESSFRRRVLAPRRAATGWLGAAALVARACCCASSARVALSVSLRAPSRAPSGGGSTPPSLPRSRALSRARSAAAACRSTWAGGA